MPMFLEQQPAQVEQEIGCNGQGKDFHPAAARLLHDMGDGGHQKLAFTPAKPERPREP